MRCLLKKTLRSVALPSPEQATTSSNKTEVDATIARYKEAVSVLLFELQTVGVSAQTLHTGNELTKTFHNFIQGKDVDFRESAAVMKLLKLIEKFHSTDSVCLK